MKRIIKILTGASLILILGSCSISNYNDNVEQNAPTKHTEQWAENYHNQRFDTLLMVRADSLELMNNNRVVLYDTELNKKYVVESQNVAYTIFRVFWVTAVGMFILMMIAASFDP